ncbi:putative aldehyde reductase 2 [Stachybotrys elegans]|uniref:Aldehyde reductase 2 n=1 Tax=Stachybotrys elegans TaxID=80388 RepID=A0A8K0WL48_9HYPO|nr:putative aldehyde reductase 2 [Stachybotrys elegans]
MQLIDRAIPANSVVVVIGANGFMAVETCEKLLQAGYRVRGTVRDVERHSAWMHALFDEKWPGMFDLVQVTDFEADQAFDEAFKGASGVIYPSTPILFDADPAKVHRPMIKGVINTLEAASRAGVKRYVLSSSSKAVHPGVFGGHYELTTDSYNYEAIEKVKAGPVENSLERIVAVFSAGRALQELAFWEWVATNKPSFVANCVVPDGQFGRILDVENMNVGPSSSTGQLVSALRGDWDKCGFDLAYFTDVQDSARLLVAALALESIKNERIFAYYVNRSWNDMRHKVKELFPDRPELVAGHDDPTKRNETSSAPGPIARAEEILRQLGRQGFTSEDDIIRDFVASMFPKQE